MCKTNLLGCKGQVLTLTALVEDIPWQLHDCECDWGKGTEGINSQKHCFILQIALFHFYMNND